MREAPAVLVSCAVVLVIFILFVVAPWAHLQYTEPRKPQINQVMCAIMTPQQPIPTFADKNPKNVRITEFGVIISDDFIYSPTPGEVCLLLRK